MKPVVEITVATPADIEIIRKNIRDVNSKDGSPEDVSRAFDTVFENHLVLLISYRGRQVGLFTSRPWWEFNANIHIWSFVSTSHVNEIKTAFIRLTRNVVKRLWEFEDKDVERAITFVRTDFDLSMRWHERVLKAERAEKDTPMFSWDCKGINFTAFYLDRKEF